MFVITFESSRGLPFGPLVPTTPGHLPTLALAQAPLESSGAHFRLHDFALSALELLLEQGEELS